MMTSRRRWRYGGSGGACGEGDRVIDDGGEGDPQRSVIAETTANALKAESGCDSARSEEQWQWPRPGRRRRRA